MCISLYCSGNFGRRKSHIKHACKKQQYMIDPHNHSQPTLIKKDMDNPQSNKSFFCLSHTHTHLQGQCVA